MTNPKPSICVNVDVTNPGQFFACCGLLEVAHLLWPGSEGWFTEGSFYIACPTADADLVAICERLRRMQLQPDNDADDDKTAPLRLRAESNATSLYLDWWLDQASGGKSLKTWAGQQRVTVIGRAMLFSALAAKIDDDWLNAGTVTHGPTTPKRPVEPFYFDARRFSHALDAGFSLDAQEATAIAHPATEFLSFVGLQRFRPLPTSDSKWSFEYWTWAYPVCATVGAGVVCGLVPVLRRRRYRFALQFRDDQKRYKAFGFANPVGGES